MLVLSQEERSRRIKLKEKRILLRQHAEQFRKCSKSCATDPVCQLMASRCGKTSSMNQRAVEVKMLVLSQEERSRRIKLKEKRILLRQHAEQFRKCSKSCDIETVPQSIPTPTVDQMTFDGGVDKSDDVSVFNKLLDQRVNGLELGSDQPVSDQG
eukprot:GHVH01001076.1.p1 GENE.GHVH01001076.1~~GHVH01001076.1.p1  ORF type:complete len:155 (-),score=23.99 GHVH01001076.1:154-618(-)